MRLLNVDTLELHEFFEEQIPPYSILSHRWGKDEVSYHDFVNRRKTNGDGFKKIRELCAVVKARRILDFNSSEDKAALEWVWIDTCCIDKSSSSELSEAINSMYQWYSRARECLVYLADVTSLESQRNNLEEKEFDHSEWFTRGWTLQELLAPEVKVFYSSSWYVLGHVIKNRIVFLVKNRLLAGDDGGTDCNSGIIQSYYGPDLSSRVSQISGIQVDYLASSDYIDLASVARRMSWASQRRTTRAEDMAYCLLGLFDVNMPLLYGEGQKAFLRLQEEIIKRSADQSIFAWCNTRKDMQKELSGANIDRSEVGLLARNAHFFRYASGIEHFRDIARRPYLITNVGLQMHINPKRVRVKTSDARCVPHVLELAAEHLERDANNRYPSIYRKVRIIMLQCLHEKQRTWYRSLSTDLLMGGLVSNKIQIRLLDEEENVNGMEIFAAIHRDIQGLCYECYIFDASFQQYLMGLASEQGMIDEHTPARADYPKDLREIGQRTIL